MYTCIASNSVGSDNGQIEVDVKGESKIHVHCNWNLTLPTFILMLLLALVVKYITAASVIVITKRVKIGVCGGSHFHHSNTSS